MIKSGKFPEFPFRVQEIEQKGLTSATVGGNIVPQIALSKKRKSANLAGVLVIKESLVKITGKEPQIDEIGVLIALFALEFLKTKPVTPPPPKKEETLPKKITPPKLDISPTKKETPSDCGKINIVMPELTDENDWESMC